MKSPENTGGDGGDPSAVGDEKVDMATGHKRRPKVAVNSILGSELQVGGGRTGGVTGATFVPTRKRVCMWRGVLIWADCGKEGPRGAC